MQTTPGLSIHMLYTRKHSQVEGISNDGIRQVSAADGRQLSSGTLCVCGAHLKPCGSLLRVNVCKGKVIMSQDDSAEENCVSETEGKRHLCQVCTSTHVKPHALTPGHFSGNM